MTDGGADVEASIAGPAGAGEEEVTAGGGEGMTAGGGGIEVGLGVCNSLPLVAQPVSHVQQMPNANQKVGDLFERRMLKNLQGSRQFR